jgi:hypothetical protein
MSTIDCPAWCTLGPELHNVDRDDIYHGHSVSDDVRLIGSTSRTGLPDEAPLIALNFDESLTPDDARRIAGTLFAAAALVEGY